MSFLLDNCISNHKLPKKAGSADAVDYSSELGLFATRNSEKGVFVWNPQNRKVVAHFRDESIQDGICEFLFLPGEFLAISEGETNHGSDISFISLKDVAEPVAFEIDEKDLQLQYPGGMALSPDNMLLVAEAFGPDVCKIQIDFENEKVLENQSIWTCEEAEEMGIENLCCSRNWNICCTNYEGKFLSCVDVKFSSSGEVELSNKQLITHCTINGETQEFGKVVGMAHDGENILVATDSNVILLESATEGSEAHIIASGISPNGQIRLNNKDQLMVCDGDKFIKVYDYKGPKTLQGLCRYQINNTFKLGGKRRVSKERKVNGLPIPTNLKDYLLYRI